MLQSIASSFEENFPGTCHASCDRRHDSADQVME